MKNSVPNTNSKIHRQRRQSGGPDRRNRESLQQCLAGTEHYLAHRATLASVCEIEGIEPHGSREVVAEKVSVKGDRDVRG